MSSCQQQQQKTSALGKPDVNLFILRTDTRQATDTTYHLPTNQPAKVTVPSWKLGTRIMGLSVSDGVHFTILAQYRRVTARWTDTSLSQKPRYAQRRAGKNWQMSCTAILAFCLTETSLTRFKFPFLDWLVSTDFVDCDCDRSEMNKKPKTSVTGRLGAMATQEVTYMKKMIIYSTLATIPSRRYRRTTSLRVPSRLNVLIYGNLNIHFVPTLGCFEMSAPFCGEILA